ncbi:outer membrane protein [Actinobacillus minor]|uniref:outer membrane protein n=1 Tax=Actinobacillus minor TaxID=51047 RepID=UPI0023F0C9E4|nr:outer membrane beta-barrel protein [Actinobacillus minor]MDD6910519.1 outer membrane beta-barrel protein [Actinobacillus minor]MDY4713869.1 outer membrane beta-barrel protein [Actinobacillus minor]
MKRISMMAAATSLFLATTSFANTFTGGYLGGTITSVKQEFSVPYSELGYQTYEGKYIADGSRGTRVGVTAGYGFDIGSNFVGQLEGELAFSNTKTTNKLGEIITKERFATNASAILGYRVLGNFLPYVKASVNASSFDLNESATGFERVDFENSAAFGFGFGAGLKYAVTEKLDLGVEYQKVTLKGNNDIKIKSKQIGLNMVYHF